MKKTRKAIPNRTMEAVLDQMVGGRFEYWGMVLIDPVKWLPNPTLKMGPEGRSDLEFFDRLTAYHSDSAVIIHWEDLFQYLILIVAFRPMDEKQNLVDVSTGEVSSD